MIGVPPSRHCGMHAAPPSALYAGPWATLGLVAAAALAGFWAAATAAFNRRYGLTIYKEDARWRLLLLWPLLLLTSAEFREQWWAAVRGRQAGPPSQQGGGGGGAAMPPA